MYSLVLLIAVIAACVAWVGANRAGRRRWLQRLHLPGQWEWEGHDGSLELTGELEGGRYRILEGEREERGAWRLEGHELVLRPGAGGAASRLDLRLFTEGRIGLHGPGREGRIYIKRRGNVVPMRRPA